MASWEGILDNVFEMKFELGEIEVMISGDLAIVVVEENLTQRGYDGAQRVTVLATNVFERVGNAWFMVMHHGSRCFAPADEELAMSGMDTNDARVFQPYCFHFFGVEAFEGVIKARLAASTDSRSDIVFPA